MLDGQDFTSSQSLRISLSELTMSYGQFCVSNRDSWRRLALAVKSGSKKNDFISHAVQGIDWHSLFGDTAADTTNDAWPACPQVHLLQH